MKILLLALSFLVMSCGPYKVEAEVKQTTPIVVTHKIDLTDLQVYFDAKCKEELTTPTYTPTSSEIKSCENDKIADFLTVIEGK